MRTVVALAVLLSVFFSPLSVADEPAPSAEPADPGAPPEAIAHWKDLRFGMFIHWGPVALTGHEIGWSRGRQTPVDKYDALHKEFNPTEFDADEWVQIAKAAGMKYLVITSKHHDGFCIWPSEHTEYDIAATPFQRDPLKELAEACRKHGLEFGAYYSVCDWRHPAFPKGSPGGRTDKPTADLDAYDQYLQGQVKELITNYGPLLVMWFDVPQVYTQKHGLSMVRMLRKLQPNIVINNRAYAEAGRTSHFNAQRMVGDFSTPEQRIGGFDRQRPWETCMTICRQWAWKPDDTMKPLDQCLQTLLHTIGGDGNLLFNVGPMPDGRIEPRQAERLKAMGEWIRPRAEAIYGTRGGPIKPGKWGAATCKGNHVYLFVMDWPDNGPLTLPALGGDVTAARLLPKGEVDVETKDGRLMLDVAPQRRDPIATVIELTVDGPAIDIPVVDPPAPPSH